ncbi:hypothetical protein P692DRAFT_201794285 [Suillus brevipes Sb2]|jgi:hypothetical protein|nr:hypothetical protein P692DRAFT_201794285 [Suillus brevipes Sb2]
MEKCYQVQMLAEPAAAALGQRPRLIDPENAAQTQKQLGSEIWGRLNGFPKFQLLEHEEGNRFEYISAHKEDM